MNKLSDNPRLKPCVRRVFQIIPGPEAIELIIGGRLVELTSDAVADHFRTRPPDPVALRLHASLHTASAVALAKRLCHEGVIVFRSHDSVQLAFPLTWAEDPLASRNWQWNLHRFVFASWLISTHRNDNDAACLRFLDDLVLDWAAKNIGPAPPSEFSWHDHATALRLEQLLLLLEHVRAHAEWGRMKRSLPYLIVLHAEILAQEDFYSRHTNHGVEQSRILYHAAMALAEHPHSLAWRTLALKRLRSEFSHAFASDGVHLENSPAYHAFVARIYFRLGDLLVPEDVPEVFTSLDSLAVQSMSFLTHVLRPDGKLPIIGDSEEVVPSNCYHEYADHPAYHALQYALRRGRAGHAPAERSALFPASGYACLRDDWHSAENWKASVHIVFKSGFLSRYHRHSDDLSFVVYAYGEDWIVDSGMYSHDSTDHIRQYVRSPQAHSTVIPTGAKAVHDPGKLEGRSTVLQLQDHSDQVSVDAISHMYPGFQVRRSLRFTRPRRIVVEDSATRTDGTPTPYCIRFHIPGDKRVSLDGGVCVAASRKTGAALRIAFAGPHPISARLVQPSRRWKLGQGIMSRTFGRAEPVWILEYEYAAAQTSVTDLVFE